MRAVPDPLAVAFAFGVGAASFEAFLARGTTRTHFVILAAFAAIGWAWSAFGQRAT